MKRNEGCLRGSTRFVRASFASLVGAAAALAAMTPHDASSAEERRAAANVAVDAGASPDAGEASGVVDDDHDRWHEEGPPPPPAIDPTTLPLREGILTVPEVDGMRRIPGGAFRLGTDDPKARLNERPSRRVYVAPFWIDKTEVTVAAYRTCVERRACAKPRRGRGCTFEVGDPGLPVNCVRFHDAESYCRFRGKRLPREAEWELAARGVQGAPYPWGADAPTCGHAATLVREMTAQTCTGDRPSRVGTHPAGASPYGVFDMSGNVEEWVADFYVERRSVVPPSVGASRVLRGGGWLSAPTRATATSRNWGSSIEAGPNVGFRCARSD